MLEINSLNFQLDGQSIVRNVNLSVGRGRVCAITGKSGVGKSTLLKLIAGLFRSHSGEIHWNGVVMSSPTCWVPPWSRPFGMVFQECALWPHLMVGQQLDFMLRTRSDLRRQSKFKMQNELLASLGLVGLEKRYPAQLSGGQRQRVAIARTIICQPKLLLLDEPFSNLDEETKENVWSVLRNFEYSEDRIVLVVTHDQDWVEKCADVSVSIEEGALLVKSPVR